MYSPIHVSFVRPNLLAACAVLVFAGCSSGAQFTSAPPFLSPHPVGQSASRATLPDDASPQQLSSPLGSEYLSGTATLPQGCPNYVNFTASGTATGAYPGTFAAGGRWILYPFGWRFDQSFTITSGAYTVSGKISGGGQGFANCHKFGRRSLPYTATVKIGAFIRHASGSAAVINISPGSLSEHLQ